MNQKPLRKQRLNMKAPDAKISEASRQNHIVTTLRSLGYAVLLLGQKRQPIFCPCGKKHWPITTANTLGTPDLLTTHPHRWPGCWLGLECKTPDTVRRPEQKAFADAGMTTIVESVEDALRAVWHLEKQMDIAPLAAVDAYLAQCKEN